MIEHMTIWQRLNAPRNRRERRVAKIARDLERERIIEIAEGHRHVYSEEHFDCDVCVTLNQLIALIKGENE